MVYRGSSALDGVISGVISGYSTTELCALISGSRHHGQIRVIVYEESNCIDFDSVILSETLGKPVLMVVDGSKFDELEMVQYNGVTVRPIGINGASSTRVLKVVSRGQRIIALNVAEKIANIIF